MKTVNLIMMFHGESYHAKEINDYEFIKQKINKFIDKEKILSMTISGKPFILDNETSFDVSKSDFYNYMFTNQILLENTIKENNVNVHIPILSKNLKEYSKKTQNKELFCYGITININDDLNIVENKYVQSIKSEFEDQFLNIFKDILDENISYVGNLILFADSNITTEYIIKTILNKKYIDDHKNNDELYRLKLNTVIGFKDKFFYPYLFFIDNKNIYLPGYTHEDFSSIISDMEVKNNIKPFSSMGQFEIISIWKKLYYDILVTKRTLEKMGFVAKLVRGDNDLINNGDVSYLYEESDYINNNKNTINYECNQFRSNVFNILMFESRYNNNKEHLVSFTIESSLDENYVDAIYLSYYDKDNNLINTHNFYGDIHSGVCANIINTILKISKQNKIIVKNNNNITAKIYQNIYNNLVSANKN